MKREEYAQLAEMVGGACMCRFPLLFALLFVACTIPTIDPGELRVRELEHGLYLEGGDKPRLTRSTEEVPCVLGSRFGAQIQVSFPRGSRGLPLSAEWRHPEVAGVRDATAPFVEGPVPVPRNAAEFELGALYEFESEEELVDGEYELRLYNPLGDQVYYSRTFVVRGCE